MSSRSHRRSTQQFETQGNLALAPRNTQEFILIEGGRGRLPESQPRVESHEAHAVREEPSLRVKALAVVAFLAFALTLAGASVLSDALMRSQVEAIDGISTTSIVVKRGDCLLGIAEEHPVSGHTAEEVVAWIKDANGLDNATILAGQRLVVPSVTDM